MNFQLEMAPITGSPADSITLSNAESVDLLRQILEVQREQLTHLRAVHDNNARWRAFLARWQSDFPNLSEACKEAVPSLERTYVNLISELTDRLSSQDDDDPLDTDFALREFLDLYGMRLAQLGTILNLVAPLAEAGPSA
ncbi:MAG TPA: hypothetical protein VGZ25_04630 [Gemmataceae bacterium]|jgi:hypothetical protein|nr:hypothetical protein [Gemmataceae bacterium]